MQKVFAKVGQNLQQIGGSCPVGWVEMSEPRISINHVAQATGVWEYPTTQTIELDRERARSVMNPLRDTFLNRLSGIAMFSEEVEIKQQCSQLRTSLLDITKSEDFLNANTYSEMEFALLSAYRSIAINAPETVRNVFRELEV